MRKSFIVLFFILSSLASATTYYVAPTGNDGSAGTYAAPWKTWAKAFQMAEAGDTVFFRAGIYPTNVTNGTGITYNPSASVGHDGTKTNPIVYMNYPGDANPPILDCSNTLSTASGYTIGVDVAYLDNVKFKGLHIRNLTKIDVTDVVIGFRVQYSNNVTVEQCVTYNISGEAFRSLSNDTVNYLNCDAHNCCDTIHQTLPGSYGSGFAALGSADRLGLVTFTGCRAWMCSDQGFGSSWGAKTVYENCWSFNNGALRGDGHGFKASINGVDDTSFVKYAEVTYKNCLAFNTGREDDEGSGDGYTTNETNGNGYKVSYYNCIAYDAERYGFRTNITTYPADRLYANNIAYANRYSNVIIRGTVNKEYTNSWNIAPFPVSSDDFISVDSTGVTGPRQADGSLPDLNFLKLKNTSDLIDKGTNVGLPYNGSFPDLGCYETSSGSSSPATPAYVSSVIENAAPSRLEMTYNLTLVNIVPAVSAFAVKVNTVTRTVTAVAVSGTKVLLTLASPIVNGDAVTVAYTKPATNPLQTSSGGQAATISAQPVTNNVAAVNPLYVSSVIENATPSRLEMTYNITLANIVPAVSAFAVKVNTVTRTVTTVAVSGTKVLLTLSAPVAFGDGVTVAYTKPATNPLQTSSGGQAASISAQPVTNNVAAVNPLYVSSVIENAAPSRLEMTYNLTLVNIVPAVSAFAVKVNTVTRTVTAVAVSGTKVLLTLASPIVNGDAVTVAYTKPATNPLQTSSGGQAATISAQPVTNNVAAVNPLYVSSVIENATPSRLEMTYNITLANIVPAVSAFAVKVNTVTRTVTTVAVSGTKVLLTLSAPVAFGDAVTVAYTKPATNPLQTSSGGQAASISAQPVTNNVAAVNPLYVSSVIENATPSGLEMTYNLTLANIVPAVSAFAVKVNTVTRTVNAVAVSGTKVLLTLESPIVYGDAVTVAYTKPATNPLQTSSGGQAASISAQPVTNNVAAVNPLYVSSVIENATPSGLEMTYNLTLANIVPAVSAFAVKVNTVTRTVTAVAVSGTKVLLTLSAPVAFGDAVTVAYTKPAANPLQTSSGGQAASSNAQPVTNNCTSPTNLPPVVNISSPTKSTSFISPATITIDAVASDPDGTITKVEFYNGSAKLGEKTALPYSYTWKEVPEGIYSITVAATDNQNLRTVTSAVSVVVEKSSTAVNQLPVVSIKSPCNGKKNRKNDKIVVEAIATDPDGTISKVEFKNGSTTLAEVITAPYIYIWEAVDTGTFMISVIATDNLGATSASVNINLIVDLVYDANSEIINLYPNPNDGHFTIDLFSDLPEGNNKIIIVSLTGQVIYNGTLTERSKEFDLGGSAAGTYIFMVTNGTAIITTKKFIKN